MLPWQAHVCLLAYFFCLFLLTNCLTLLISTYSTLYRYAGIVHMVTTSDSGMIRQSIRELEIMLDDKEITAPILILFSPPTGDRNVENIIRDYNLTDIIEKVRCQLAEITLIFFGLFPKEMDASLCSLTRYRPPNLISAGVWKVSQGCDRYHHTHDCHNRLGLARKAGQPIK